MSRRDLRAIGIGLAVCLVLGGGLAAMAIWTQPVRWSLATYSELVSLGNRTDLPEDARLDRARQLCSSHYLNTHRLALSDEGGIVGLPRNINKNFQAWRDGRNVRICPSNRVGPVYQLVLEGGRWKFDGPVGLLRPRGEFISIQDIDDFEE